VGVSVQDLMDASAPFWLAEAEVVRTYFESPDRNRGSDLAWLARQCHKELFDGVVRRLDSARERLESLDAECTSESFGSDLRVAVEELTHYQAFATVYDALRRPRDSRLSYRTLRDDWNWPENVALGELRRQHREKHGDLGVRACLFTEGGGGTLYEEGLKLRGRSATDDLVADACEQVHADEVGHMLEGVEHADLTSSELATLRDLTMAQLELRLPMRNAQFGCPLAQEDLLRAAS
jgi:hypothetical protein